MTRRILFNTEFSQHCTGYAKLTKEVMTRLHNNTNYELAELAAYCKPEDPRIFDVPWKIYPVLPADNDERGINEYNAHPTNSCGRHKWNHVLLDFLPTDCIDARDQWYKDFEHTSPFRPYYNLIWINPVDGTPQDVRWLQDAIDSDAVMTYTDWGKEVLQQHSNKIKYGGLFPLGVNFNDFFPIPNKKGLKKHFGFQEDVLVIGFVARNQYRKLFDDLLQCFANFLTNAPQDIAKKTFLYFHTSTLDLGWKFPQLLIEYGLGTKVLFTYYCKNCQQVYPSVYQDLTAICKHCGQPALAPPRPTDNLTEANLNLIYNFFDVHCLLSSNEGQGITGVESAACAIPSMVINYSGCEDMIKKIGAIPLKVDRLRREPELHRLIAVPDLNDLAQKFVDILSIPDSLRREIGFKQMLKCRQHYTWDIAVNNLINIIEQLPTKNWKSPLRFHQPQMFSEEQIKQMSPEQFVYFLYKNVVGMPEKFNTYEGMRKVHNLIMGYTGHKPDIRQYNNQMALHEALSENEYRNQWEMARKQKLGL